MFRKKVVELLKRHVKVDVDSLLEIPPSPELGDYAFPCFVLAKEYKKSPMAIAEDLAKKIKPNKAVVKAQNVGPYVNFFISPTALSEETLKKIFKEKHKYGNGKSKQSVMLEYPSPNTNKPMHLGHVRNILLGNSIRNLLKKQGIKIIISNLYNDRGIAMCKAMLAYKKWGHNKTPESEGIKPDFFVGDYYVLYCQREKEDAKLQEEAQGMLRKWEAGDKETIALWKKLLNWVIDGYKQTLKTFDYRKDVEYHEHQIYDKGKDIILKGLERCIFEKDETGAVIARLDKYKLTDKVLLRSDGTAIYITQDIYLAIKKFKDYKLDKSVYIVGSEQIAHFNSLFAILDLLGYKGIEKCYHLSYGMVYLPSGRMKSREGNVVEADDLVKEMASVAKVEVERRHKLTEKEATMRARQIGMGALKFHMLKCDPVKDMTYNPEESVSFEGDTGPYVQYAHARCVSMSKKAKQKLTANVEYSSLKSTFEQDLIKMLADYPNVIADAAEHYRPSSLAHFLISLAQKFNDFYQNCPCLTAGEDERKAKLLLVECTRIVLEDGLNLLGIEAPESM